MEIELNGYEEQKEKSPILKARKEIETRLVGMEELLGNYALEASMAGDYRGSIPDVTLAKDDNLDENNISDIIRFYEINSYRAQGARNFSFTTLGLTTAIEYRFIQNIDVEGNLLPVYDRFSERYIATIGQNRYTFQNPGDCINFLFHLHRAVDFKNKNKPITFEKGRGRGINIQNTTIKNGKTVVKTIPYYRTLPNPTSVGIEKQNRTTFWNEEQKEVTTISPSIDLDGNIDIQTSTKTVDFNQAYTNDYGSQTTTQSNLDEKYIDENIIVRLNTQ